jgi:hypothetical protein
MPDRGPRHQVSSWPARQCMCCFADIANFEKFNSILQRILGKAIKFLGTLVKDIKRETGERDEEEEEEDPEKLQNENDAGGFHDQAGDGGIVIGKLL